MTEPSTPPQSGYLAAHATADGNVVGLWRDVDGSLHITYVNEDEDPGIRFDRHELPAIVDMLRRALAMLEGSGS
jgi:hypothetical protein